MKKLSMDESLTMLLSRLPQQHPQREFLETELHRHSAGKRGEGRLVEKFREFYSIVPHEILWDVGLAINHWRVQMDGLLLTESCAIIIESKNISGKIHFDSLTDEFYRFNSEGEKTVMEDPTVQLEKHVRFLQSWFKLNGIELAVEGILVFTSKQCEFINKSKGMHICKTYQMNGLFYKILEANSSQLPLINPKEIKDLIINNLITYNHPPLCVRYFINRSDLKQGVRCTMCKEHSVKRVLKKWICAECGHRDPKAHRLAIQEFFALVDTEMSNREFRQFCGIDSVFVASRLLAEFDLAKSGNKKNRRYRLYSENPPVE